MVKRKNRSKRSASRLPKGLPVRKGDGSTNPFEISHRQKRSKFQVANRPTSQSPSTAKVSKLAQALQRRKDAIREAYKSSKKANVFVDKRIGEYDNEMTAEQQNLARLVKERSRRSKRNTKYSLDDNDDNDNGGGDTDVLTHRGRAVDPSKAVLLSDDEDDDGNLDAADTEMHFGGLPDTAEETMYGGSASGTGRMSQLYAQRKTDLDDLIARRKDIKAAKLQSKEMQEETFDAMDKSFGELKDVLQFRDKESEIKKHLKQKREGTLSEADQEMADWDKEMKQYLYMERKVKATDRTKTPEEIAKEEADRLHELETRRLARMNGDFEEDDFSDVSDDENNKKRRKRQKRTKTNLDNPEALSDSEDESDDDDKITTRFTADGLVKVNKDGLVVGKVGDEELNKGAEAVVQLASELSKPLTVGTKVEASYRANEQYDGNESWFQGTISRVNDKEGSYDVDYDDGDFEEGVEARHIRVAAKSEEEVEKELEEQEKEASLKRKRQKAKEKARSELPFVFEVPTTLEALHEMIGNHATTGADASLIVERIHRANSVRLDKRNAEKMQNFYDVVIRRFIAIGDAVNESGDGGSELGRYKQLDSLMGTMYDMAHDAPEIAAAVWSRRLGFLQNAHSKRLRDAEFVHQDDEENVSAWPSTGVVMALRAIGHIFPPTDLRHQIVTPTLLLLGQMIGYTPVMTVHDAVIGTMCACIVIEYTREAKRISPEAHGFLAGIIRLFAPHEKERRLGHPLPSLESAAEQEEFKNLRKIASSYIGSEVPRISLEAENIEAEAMPAALLYAALHLSESSATNLSGSCSAAEKEVFAEITSSVLALNPKSKSTSLPVVLQKKIASVASTLSSLLKASRTPIQRRLPASTVKTIKSLAPRLEDPEKYSLSRDKGKNATQAAADRARREYRREHKAVARELRMDAAMVEGERRREQDKKDAAAKAKRQRAFAWLEGDQAAMNQQVRQGGGVLQGGGMGAARAKAATAKLGIKKGGKLK